MTVDLLTPLTGLTNAVIAKDKKYTDSAVAGAAPATGKIQTSVAVAAASGSVPGTTTNSALGVAIGGDGVMYSIQTTPEAANTNTYDILVLDDLGNTVYSATSLSGPQKDDLVFHYVCAGQLQVKINNYGATALTVDVVLLTSKMNVVAV